MVESGNLELVFGALDLLSGKGGEKKSVTVGEDS